MGAHASALGMDSQVRGKVHKGFGTIRNQRFLAVARVEEEAVSKQSELIQQALDKLEGIERMLRDLDDRIYLLEDRMRDYDLETELEDF